MIEGAKQLAIPVAIAIVDDAGNSKAYVAMDNQWPNRLSKETRR
jgi:uncharacterized protein GlcG (DUF336 family)